MVTCCCWWWCGCCSRRFLSRLPFLGFVSVAARTLSLGQTGVGTVVGRGTCSPFSPWCCSLRTIQSFLGNVSVSQVTVWQMPVACSSCCCSSCSVTGVTVRPWSSMRIVQATPNAVHCWPPVGAGHDAVTMTNTTTQHTQGKKTHHQQQNKQQQRSLVALSKQRQVGDPFVNAGWVLTSAIDYKMDHLQSYAARQMSLSSVFLCGLTVRLSLPVKVWVLGVAGHHHISTQVPVRRYEASLWVAIFGDHVHNACLNCERFHVNNTSPESSRKHGRDTEDYGGFSTTRVGS